MDKYLEAEKRPEINSETFPFRVMNSNKILNVDDEFNHNGQHSQNSKDNHFKEFLSNYQVEEIEPDVFQILFDLYTREAGADYAVIDNTRIKIVCEDYEIN